MQTQAQTQTQTQAQKQYRVITGETYEVFGHTVRRIYRVDGMEEIGNEHARLINSGYCIDALHADWRIMAILIAKKLYGVEI